MAGSEDQANSPHSIIRGGYCSYLIFFFFFLLVMHGQHGYG